MPALVTCSIRDLPASGPRWAIVRFAMMQGPAWRLAGVRWEPGMAPSAALHRWWRSMLADHGPLAPWEQYVARWHAEKADDARYWRLVAEAARCGGLVLACWCRDEARCHRTLVARDVQARGGARA